MAGHHEASAQDPAGVHADDVGCAQARLCESDVVVSSAMELDAVSQCIQIHGDLTIADSAGDIQHLDALSCLRAVSGDVWIHNNAALVSIAGLSGLRAVGGDVEISGNGALANMGGLEGVRHIGGNVSLAKGRSLEAGWLSASSTAGEELYLHDNVIVGAAADEGQAALPLSLAVASDPSLAGVDGLLRGSDAGLIQLHASQDIEDASNLLVTGMDILPHAEGSSAAEERDVIADDGWPGLISLRRFLSDDAEEVGHARASRSGSLPSRVQSSAPPRWRTAQLQLSQSVRKPSSQDLFSSMLIVFGLGLGTLQRSHK